MNNLLFTHSIDLLFLGLIPSKMGAVVECHDATDWLFSLLWGKQRNMTVHASLLGAAFWLAAGDNVIAELAKLHLRGRASPQILNPWWDLRCLSFLQMILRFFFEMVLSTNQRGLEGVTAPVLPALPKSEQAHVAVKLMCYHFCPSHLQWVNLVSWW